MNPLICAWFLIAAASWHLPMGDAQIVEALVSEGVEAKVVDEGVYILLPGVTFESNRDDINEMQQAMLSGVCKVLLLNGVKSRYIYVEGHTDSVGSDFYNKRLSQRRADRIHSRLLECGVKADQVFAVGLGEQYPISEDPIKNRRVEILLRAERRVL